MRSAAFITLAMLVPVIPFLLFGPQCEAWIVSNVLENRGFQENRFPAAILAIGILAIDIFLPVPSSGVMTFAGAVLGSGIAIITCSIGLNLSCLLGYEAARKFGMRFVTRFADRRDLAATSLSETKNFVAKSGRWLLIALRPLPIVAEASVLLAGAYGMPRSTFWPPVLIANVLISCIWCTLGEFAGEGGWFVGAMAASIVAPMLVLTLWLAASTRFGAKPNSSVE